MVDWNGIAWCSQHKCHPMKCWEEHTSYEPKGSISVEDHTKQIAERHREVQRSNGYSPVPHTTKTVVTLKRNRHA